ncbi:hypothetical protein PAMP_018165 [Pampus punctatissimus]
MLKDVEQMLLDHNQLEQKCEEKTEAETILTIEQKSSLNEKLLKMKTEAVAELHVKVQVKLWMALVFTHGDQTAARNLKELCESRHATLKALKQDRALEEYDELEKTLKTLGTSVPRRDVLKHIRASAVKKGSEVISYHKSMRRCLVCDWQKLEDFIEQLKALCVSEDTRGQKTAASESR